MEPIPAYCSDLAMGGFQFMFKIKIVMLGNRQTIFATSYFLFETSFHFLFVLDPYM